MEYKCPFRWFTKKFNQLNVDTFYAIIFATYYAWVNYSSSKPSNGLLVLLMCFKNSIMVCETSPSLMS